jgi:oligopeptidase A
MEIDFQPKNIVKRIQNLTEDGLKLLKQAANGKDWAGVTQKIDILMFELGKQTSLNSHLNAVLFNEDFSAEYDKTLPLISHFYTELSSNKPLFKAYKSLLDTQLNTQQMHIVKTSIAEFERSGVGLDGENLKHFKDIQTRLSLLSNDFSKNTLKSTSAWKKSVSKEDLAGYSEAELAKVRTSTGCELSLQIPVYMDAMTYLDDSNLRELIYNAYISRASAVGITPIEFDNTKIMHEILMLRQQLAELLGFEHYAQLSIASKMVESSEQVVDFLEILVSKSKHQAQQELKALQAFAGKTLEPWDLLYFSEKFKEKIFGFKKSDLTPYFPENQVLKGLFLLIKRLYGVTVELCSETTYHSDVKVLLLSKNNQLIGKIYLDLYARENKRGGAWMSDYQPLMGENKPIAFVVCNLNSPTDGKPALFEFDEIVTIFHEFGHALHHLLTRVKYPSVAGIAGVPWDGVELPSQYMEFYAYEREVIELISAHYQTGEALPENLYQKLIDSKNFHSALQMLRQCEFSLWDIKTHMGKQDTYKVLASIRRQTALMPAVKNNRFLNTFGHVFAGGYSAGYFSYKWAEVLAADAFYFVKAQGGIDSDAAQNFLSEILEVGGSLDFMQQYKKFRGKNPSIDALLLSNGIGE